MAIFSLRVVPATQINEETAMRFLFAVFLLASTAGSALAHTPDGAHDVFQVIGHQLLSPHHLPGLVVIVVMLLMLPFVRAKRRR